MSRFYNTCKVEDIDGDNWRLLETVRYESALLGGVIEVPVNFLTDFASIPQLVQNIIPQHGLQDEPALVHDYLYATQTVSKKTADGVLYEAMLACHVPPVRAWIIYQAVNWFGGMAWRGDQKKYGLVNRPS